MNKTKLLILALCVIVLTGCGEATQEQRDANMTSRITEFNYKGHRYLFYQDCYGNQGYAGIAHDPDCPCHKEDVKEP